MRFTRQEEVAIILTGTLARNPGAVIPLSAVSAEHGIPLPFLKKVARLLAHAHIVSAREGVGGGYTLGASPSALGLLHVLAAAGGKSTEQGVPSTACPLLPTCLPQRVRSVLDSALAESLGGVTVADLIA